MNCNDERSTISWRGPKEEGGCGRAMYFATISGWEVRDFDATTAATDYCMSGFTTGHSPCMKDSS